MEFCNPYTLTMAHTLQVHYLLNLPQIGNLITTQMHPGVSEVMAKWLSCRSPKDSSTM